MNRYSRNTDVAENFEPSSPAPAAVTVSQSRPAPRASRARLVYHDGDGSDSGYTSVDPDASRDGRRSRRREETLASYQRREEMPAPDRRREDIWTVLPSQRSKDDIRKYDSNAASLSSSPSVQSRHGNDSRRVGSRHGPDSNPAATQVDIDSPPPSRYSLQSGDSFGAYRYGATGDGIVPKSNGDISYRNQTPLPYLTTMQPTTTSDRHATEPLKPQRYLNYGARDADYTYLPLRMMVQQDSKDTSSRLSSLGRQFVQIALSDYTACQEFVLNHPEIVEEDTDTYLAEAVSAFRQDNEKLARSCLGKSIILRNCKKEGNAEFFRKLLSRSGGRQFKEDLDIAIARTKDRVAKDGDTKSRRGSVSRPITAEHAKISQHRRPSPPRRLMYPHEIPGYWNLDRHRLAYEEKSNVPPREASLERKERQLDFEREWDLFRIEQAKAKAAQMLQKVAAAQMLQKAAAEQTLQQFQWLRKDKVEKEAEHRRLREEEEKAFQRETKDDATKTNQSGEPFVTSKEDRKSENVQESRPSKSEESENTTVPALLDEHAAADRSEIITQSQEDKSTVVDSEILVPDTSLQRLSVSVKQSETRESAAEEALPILPDPIELIPASGVSLSEAVQEEEQNSAVQEALPIDSDLTELGPSSDISVSEVVTKQERGYAPADTPDVLSEPVKISDQPSAHTEASDQHLSYNNNPSHNATAGKTVGNLPLRGELNSRTPPGSPTERKAKEVAFDRGGAATEDAVAVPIANPKSSLLQTTEILKADSLQREFMHSPSSEGLTCDESYEQAQRLEKAPEAVDERLLETDDLLTILEEKFVHKFHASDSGWRPRKDRRFRKMVDGMVMDWEKFGNMEEYFELKELQLDMDRDTVDKQSERHRQKDRDQDAREEELDAESEELKRRRDELWNLRCGRTLAEASLCLFSVYAVYRIWFQ